MCVWMPARVGTLPRLCLEEDLLDQLVDLMERFDAKRYIKDGWEQRGRVGREEASGDGEMRE
jgi:hypothetical protein